MNGDLLALISALLWAIASVLLGAAARQIHVLPLNLVRCVTAALFFWMLLPFYGGFRAVAAIPASAWIWLVVSVLAFLVIGDTLYFRSLELAGVSWAMPVASISPLWAVLLARLFLDEPLSWALLAGSVLVVAGVALVGRTVGSTGSGRPIDPGRRRTGLLLALVVSILWAVGQVALRPATAGIHSVVANSVRQPLGMATLLLLNLKHGRWRELRSLDRRAWAVVVVASLMGTGLGTLFLVMATQTSGAGRTAVLTSTAPLMAIPFSMMWLHERPTRWSVVGTALTTAGIALVA